MGCDIHAFIERKTNENWRMFAKLNLNRDYRLFASLADVRNCYDIACPTKPKGLPADLSWRVKDACTLFVVDEEEADRGYVTKLEADEWLRRGISVMMEEKRISNPDWHTPSWLILSEINKAHAEYIEKTGHTDGELSTIAVMLEELGKAYDGARLVFWFDN